MFTPRWLHPSNTQHFSSLLPSPILYVWNLMSVATLLRGGNEIEASRTATCTQDQTRLARNNAMNDRLHLFRSKRNHTSSPCHSLSMFFLTSRDLELKKSVFSSGILVIQLPSYSCHWLSMPSGAVVVRSIQGLAAWQPSASSHGLERVERRQMGMSWNVYL